MNDFIRHLIIDVITYPCLDWSYSKLAKGCLKISACEYLNMRCICIHLFVNQSDLIRCLYPAKRIIVFCFEEQIIVHPMLSIVYRGKCFMYILLHVCVCARASAYVCAYLWFVLIYVGLKYFQHYSPTYVIFLCRDIYNFISMQGLNVTWQLSWSHLRSAVPSNTSIRLNVSKAHLHTKAR